MRAWALLLSLGCVASCVTVGDEADDQAAGGKADGSGTCADATYGDGVCHMDLACGIPDIDCFTLFTSDEEAKRAAEADGLYPLPVTDARYAPTRARLDRSWAMYKAGVSLAQLADKHLGLVIVSDSEVNAFVYATSTPGVAYFMVVVNSGLVDSAMTDDEFHGIMFHELTHLAKQHTADEVPERTRRYYVAPEGAEPIGALQSDSARVREALEEWRSLADDVGIFTYPELADLPYGWNAHELLRAYVELGKSIQPACHGAFERVRGIAGAPQYNAVDQSLVIAPTHQTEAMAAVAALEQCMIGTTLTLGEVASRTGLERLVSGELAGLAGLPALTGLRQLMGLLRAKMRALEASFPVRTGRPFESARFFSTEEQADDISARLTKANNLTDRGVSGFLFAALAERRGECEALLAGGGPVPYGRFLLGDHHADCWRIAHARQLTQQDATPRIELDRPTREPWIPTRVPQRRILH